MPELDELNYYYTKRFDTFEEARDYQHKVLLEGIAEGKVVRSCTFDINFDYDAKKQVFSPFVRFVVFSQLEGDTEDFSTCPLPLPTQTP